MKAQVSIQWKGTEACMDFHCPCTPDDQAYEAHLDARMPMSGYLACPTCGALYQLPDKLKLRPVAADDPLRGYVEKYAARPVLDDDNPAVW